MKIVIDGRMTGERWTGIGLYGRKLIEQLQQIDRTNQYIILLDREEYGAWRPSAPNFRKVLAPYKVYGFGEQIVLPFKLWALKPDLIHFLHFNLPIVYRSRRIVTIHDTTLVDFNTSPGGLLTDLKYRIKRLGMLGVLRFGITANTIITPSQATKDSLVKRYGSGLGKHITVTHEAVDLPSQPSTHPLTHRPAKLLYVGNLYPYKNVGLILQALPQIIAALPGTTLTIVGQTPSFSERLEAQSRKLGLDQAVNFAGFARPSQLDRLYTETTLFIFPSLSEGFGLPPLEAMAHGTPVLAARASCLPEILGSAAHYFDPHNPRDLAQKTTELLNDSKKLVDMQSKGFAQLKKYSWKHMAEQTLEVYKKS